MRRRGGTPFEVTPLVGSIPDGWQITTLGALCDRNDGSVQTGPFGSQLHAEDYITAGTPVVMPKNLGVNQIDPTDIARIGSEDVSRLERHTLQVGDIVFPRRGDISRYAYITDEYAGWLCGTGCLRIRLGTDEATSRFLSYYLAHPNVQEWITSNGVGTTMLNLNTSIIRALPVTLPDEGSRSAIAHILGTLDDKIELNRRMNATLEALARAIFKSWFVDFDPVHAKARREQPIGMDAATAALFPDRFEDSALGPIPAGWKIKPLDEIATYQNGLALQNFPPENDEFLPVLKIRELRQGYVDDNSDLATSNIKEECIVYDGDVIFSWSGSLMLDLWCGDTAALNQHLFKVTSEEYPKWFYYLWTCLHLEDFQRIAAGKATTMGHIQRRHLSAALTLVPPDDLMSHLSPIIAPCLEKVLNNRLESRTLTEIRDALLPKLMSGDLRVEFRKDDVGDTP